MIPALLSHQLKCSVLVSTLGKSLHLKVTVQIPFKSVHSISANDFNRAGWSHFYISFYIETMELNCIAFQQQYTIAIMNIAQPEKLAL